MITAVGEQSTNFKGLQRRSRNQRNNLRDSFRSSPTNATLSVTHFARRSVRLPSLLQPFPQHPETPLFNPPSPPPPFSHRRERPHPPPRGHYPLSYLGEVRMNKNEREHCHDLMSRALPGTSHDSCVPKLHSPTNAPPTVSRFVPRSSSSILRGINNRQLRRVFASGGGENGQI